uniref:Titin-like n=1 Tax=Panagrellus redivivus TaxID=6233 RepID=A0A7E4VSB9_PANRE
MELPRTIRFLRQKRGSPFPSSQYDIENMPPIYRDAFLNAEPPQYNDGNNNCKLDHEQSNFFWDTYKPLPGQPEPNYNIYKAGERVVFRQKPASMMTPPVPMRHRDPSTHHKQLHLPFIHSNYHLLPPATSGFVWSIKGATPWPELQPPPYIEPNPLIDFTIKQELEPFDQVVEPYPQVVEPYPQVVESVAEEIERLEQKPQIVVPFVEKPKRGRPRKNPLPKVPYKRGRPRKPPTEPPKQSDQPTNPVITEPKKRGRPRKHPISKPQPKFVMPNGETRKRGRPPKNGPKRSLPPKTPLPKEPRKPGRPRKYPLPTENQSHLDQGTSTQTTLPSPSTMEKTLFGTHSSHSEWEWDDYFC